MNIRFLRRFDRLFGPLLLLTLGPLTKLIATLLPAPAATSFGPDVKRCVFLKLKGGGSLIVALPTLLAMRRAAPHAKFILVCTQGTKIYAELTGLFDDYAIIQDTSPLSLGQSAIAALKKCFRSDLCIDLEPHGMMTAAFCAMTLSTRRIGFVKPTEPYRAASYTDALAFNFFSPIFYFYDQVAHALNIRPASQTECQNQLRRQILTSPKSNDNYAIVIGIAPFASDLAPERMMPQEIWGKLLQQTFKDKKIRLQIFGSLNNRQSSAIFIDYMQSIFPNISIDNFCGQFSLSQSISMILNCDDFWAVDSGLLHIARMLVVKCRSFWGPTSPYILLRPIEGLQEIRSYHNFACSPCVHVTPTSPCKGNNVCMKTLAEPDPDRAPIWSA